MILSFNILSEKLNIFITISPCHIADRTKSIMLSQVSGNRNRLIYSNLNAFGLHTEIMKMSLAIVLCVDFITEVHSIFSATFYSL